MGSSLISEVFLVLMRYRGNCESNKEMQLEPGI